MDENIDKEKKVIIVLKEIGNKTKKVFAGESSSYKQKIIYNLLGAIKTNNKMDFLQTFLRVINAKMDIEDTKELADMIMKNIVLPSAEFEKIEYVIILGIMSSNSEK